MEKKKTDKVKHQFTPEEAAGYLRQLADDLEKGVLVFNSEDMELEGEIKVKEQRKAKNGHATVKVKLKFESPVHQEEPVPGETPEKPELEPEAKDDKEPSYKKIKKAMAKEFSALKKLAAQEDAPVPPEDVDSFAGLARQMCEFKGEKYGEEHYEGFLAALARLEQAGGSGDRAGLQAALGELGEMKSACHDKYK